MATANPNWVAYFALLIFPLVAFGLYSVLSISKATLWTILGAYLLLPVGAEIKIAGIPTFDKNSIPNIAALLCSSIWAGRFPKLFRGFGMPEILIVALLASPFLTSMLNGDAIQIGITYLPGVGPYDALSAAGTQFIFMSPFFLGRQLLRQPENNGEILRVMALAGLAYSIPMLFEVRMSPQLHAWIYGYYPTDFIQEIRDGGFRPMVFMGHGLLVAFFAMTTLVAAASLWRTKARILKIVSPGALTAYLTSALVLCKTASALFYALLLVPLIRWASPRLQLRVAVVLALVTITYPLVRAAGLIPTTSILQIANSLNAERGESLKTRFDNEDQLLDRAWQRPWFGWGRYGRNRVYNGWNGGDSSITDGHWIITMGQFGITGFIAEFGLLALSIFSASRSLKFARPKWEREYLAALAIIVGVNMIDLLPNSSIRPWTWLLAGALLGRAEALQAITRREPLPRNVLSHSHQLRDDKPLTT